MADWSIGYLQTSQSEETILRKETILFGLKAIYPISPLRSY